MNDQADTRTILETLAAPDPDLTVKGKKMPYLAVNGNMFAFVDAEDMLCLRYGEVDRARLAEDFAAGPVMQYNAVMRGYVAIPAETLGDADALADLFAQSVAFAKALRSKPTKR